MSQVSEPVTPAPGVRIDRPGIADIVFLFTAVVVVVNSAKGLLDDPGLGWHLRNIDAMWAEGWWLTKDPFTHPRGEELPPWYTNQWLGELPLYLGWKLAGVEGIAVVCGLIIATIARTMYRIFIADGLPWPVAVVWTALGAVGTSCSWVARPNLFTILFVLITARVLVLYHEGRLSRRGTLWLLPLFAIWANTHGGFLAGFILGVIAGAAEVALAVCSLDPEKRRAARGRAVHLALLGVGLVLATLINPYGPWLYRHAFGLLGDDYFMKLHMEWKSPDFQGAGAMRFEILMLLFPLVMATSQRRPNLTELALAIAWLHLALTGFRYVALWAAVAVPMMARASLEIGYLREVAARMGLSTDPGSLFHTQPEQCGRWTDWLWTALFAVAICGWAWLYRGQVIEAQQKKVDLAGVESGRKVIIPHTALDIFVRLTRDWQQRNKRQPVIFHSYDWGGYITWHAWKPNGEGVLNWIDDRNEVQGRARVEEYLDLMQGRPGWQEKLDRPEARVDLICIEKGTGLAERLAQETSKWREVPTSDRIAVIYERQPGK